MGFGGPKVGGPGRRSLGPARPVLFNKFFGMARAQPSPAHHVQGSSLKCPDTSVPGPKCLGTGSEVSNAFSGNTHNNGRLVYGAV